MNPSKRFLLKTQILYWKQVPALVKSFGFCGLSYSSAPTFSVFWLPDKTDWKKIVEEGVFTFS